PDREREHSTQTLNELLALLFVEVDEALGVRLRAERVALRLEVRAQLVEVVDLAVERDPERAVLVRERLTARGREVDDRETSMPERGGAEDLDPFAVGPPVRECAGHGADGALVSGTREVAPHFSRDPAHTRAESSTPRATSPAPLSSGKAHARPDFGRA